MIGIWQLVLILIIVFAFFGAGKLPSVMEDIGRGIRNLKKGLQDAEYIDKKSGKKKTAVIAKAKSIVAKRKKSSPSDKKSDDNKSDKAE